MSSARAGVMITSSLLLGLTAGAGGTYALMQHHQEAIHTQTILDQYTRTKEWVAERRQMEKEQLVAEWQRGQNALGKLYMSMHQGIYLSTTELDRLLPAPVPICRQKFSFTLANPDCPPREEDMP